MPLDQPRKASTFAHDPMGTSSSSLTQSDDQSANKVSQSFYLQTMQLSLPTQGQTYNSSGTGLQMLSRTLGVYSASKRCRWWVRTCSIHHQSASLTMNWKPFTSLCTWAQQLLTASPLRPKSTGALEKPPLHSPSRHKESGRTANSPSTVKSGCTSPAHWASYFTAVNHVLCTWSKTENSTPSTCAACGASLTSPGETEHPTAQRLRGQGSPYSSQGACSDWAMSPWWKTTISPRTFSTEKLATGKRIMGRPQLHFKDIWSASMQFVCDRCAIRQRLQTGLSLYEHEDTLTQQAEKERAHKESQPQHCAVSSAVQTVTATLGSAATAGDVFDSSTSSATPSSQRLAHAWRC